MTSQEKTAPEKKSTGSQEASPAPASSGQRKGSPGNRELLKQVLRYAGRPVFLALVLLGLYLWVGTQQLDSIERRNLNADVIVTQTMQHIQLAAVSTVIVVALAVSAGILLTRPFARGFSPFIVGAANIGQATPSIGLLVLFAIVWSTGFWPAIVALVSYSFLVILRNTMVGLQQVDRSTIESARGMGMTKTATLFRIELPLAVPIILAGVRTALILNVGTAALATFTGAGGLGDMIRNGIVLSRETVIIAGAILSAVLALFIDWLGGVAEDLLRPKGL